MTTAQYRLLSPAGEVSEDGTADVAIRDGTLVLAPSAEDVLRIASGQITAISEPGPFSVRVTLADGTILELFRLGVMRTQLLAELRDCRAERAALAAGALGEAVVFAAAVGAEPAGARSAEVRVYEDALLILVDGAAERVSFSFVRAVRTANYAVTVEVDGRAPLVMSRLGRRTSEFADLLTVRLANARGRTAAFLGALLPGLGAVPLRQTASLLRDGVAVSVSTLNGVHPAVGDELLRMAVLPGRREAATELGRRCDLAIGFKQITSVTQAAVGVTPWRDPATGPHPASHDSPADSFAPGLAGMMAAGVMSGLSAVGGAGADGPIFGFGEGCAAYGGYWALRALGAGFTAGQTRPMMPRPDMTRGRLTPAAEDLAALVMGGKAPTVLAFVLGHTADLVVFDVLNQPTAMTFVYRAAAPQGVAVINRALDDVAFQPGVATATGLGSQPGNSGSPLLDGSLADVIPHDVRWVLRIAALLSGGGPA